MALVCRQERDLALIRSKVGFCPRAREQAVGLLVTVKHAPITAFSNHCQAPAWPHQTPQQRDHCSKLATSPRPLVSKCLGLYVVRPP
jgi:hypothetical protein